MWVVKASKLREEKAQKEKAELQESLSASGKCQNFATFFFHRILEPA
jgi:hypothetical protein